MFISGVSDPRLNSLFLLFPSLLLRMDHLNTYTSFGFYLSNWAKGRKEEWAKWVLFFSRFSFARLAIRKSGRGQSFEESCEHWIINHPWLSNLITSDDLTNFQKLEQKNLHLKEYLQTMVLTRNKKTFLWWNAIARNPFTIMHN